MLYAKQVWLIIALIIILLIVIKIFFYSDIIEENNEKYNLHTDGIQLYKNILNNRHSIYYIIVFY